MRTTPHTSRQIEYGNRPIFIESSGVRRKFLRFTATVVGCACGGYLLFVGILVSGMWNSSEQQPPTTNEPLPAGPARHESPAPATPHTPRTAHDSPPFTVSGPPDATPRLVPAGAVRGGATRPPHSRNGG